MLTSQYMASAKPDAVALRRRRVGVVDFACDPVNICEQAARRPAGGDGVEVMRARGRQGGHFGAYYKRVSRMFALPKRLGTCYMLSDRGSSCRLLCDGRCSLPLSAPQKW